jgi:hypothetical protein
MSKSILPIQIFRSNADPNFSTQKILHRGRLVEAGVVPADPIADSIGLELDMINIL